MLRTMIVLTAAAVLAAMALAPPEATAARYKARGARATFHGAEVYLPGYYYAGFNAPPIFPDGSAYCWHWFRVGRSWGTTWAC